MIQQPIRCQSGEVLRMNDVYFDQWQLNAQLVPGMDGGAEFNGVGVGPLLCVAAAWCAQQCFAITELI